MIKAQKRRGCFLKNGKKIKERFTASSPHAAENSGLGGGEKPVWAGGCFAEQCPPASHAWLLLHIFSADLFGYAACSSLGRETACTNDAAAPNGSCGAGRFFSIACSSLAVLVGTTSQLMRLRCGRCGVKVALEHPAPETRQP